MIHKTSVKIYFTLLLVLCLTSCLKKGDEDIDYYEEIPELTNRMIYDMVIDSKGNKWCATSTGLLKFDGYQIVNYTKDNGLASDTIWSLAVDSEDVIWCINHNDKITRFDGNTFTIKNIYDPQAIMVDKKNILWVAAHYGLMSFDGTNWINHETTFANSNAWAYNMFEGPENTIFIVSANTGLLEFKNGSFTKIESIDTIPSYRINGIAFDKATNTTYYATNGYGLVINKNGTYSLINLGDDYRDNLVYTVKLDQKGQAWMGTESGLFLYNGKISNFKPPKIPLHPVKKLVPDAQNNIWVLDYSIVLKVLSK